MELNAPAMPLFIVSLIIAVLGLIGHLIVLPVLTPLSFWLAIVAYVVLAVGCLMKGT